MKYGIQFDFDAGGETPGVYIADRGGHGTCFVEVLEEPVFSGDLNDLEDLVDGDCWQAGPLANYILQQMNKPECP